MFRIAVLVSGNGSNLQAIIDAKKEGYLNVKIASVIADRDCFALQRAKDNGISTYLLSKKDPNFQNYLYNILTKNADLVVCAGFLSIIEKKIIDRFRNKIINIHPALLPSFGGKGMYGEKVHRKVLEYGVKISGCTVHFIDENVDCGPIIFQYALPVLDDDDVNSLSQRILVFEHQLIVEAIKLISLNKIKVEGRKVTILS
ncbi:MAG: phosphoribosylglycinamide formyltransferase [Spirochaetales bacterium]|nr:phosphoribosylglycinamide formyltransferase [Spirochaetales bacterium]